MQIGVVFPQTELGGSAANVRRYAEGVEALGFAHVLVYDHVVGADPEVHAPWRGPYDIRTTFHEPFVLFGFLAGFSRLGLVTGIIIAPQRQTALIAKQAAEVDLLTALAGGAIYVEHLDERWLTVEILPGEIIAPGKQSR